MALKTFIIGIFIVVSIFVFVDCTATMLINNDPVEENPLLQVTGYIIFDLAAMLVWLCRVFIECGFWLFTLGDSGDPFAAVMIVFQCAISFLYHLIAFGLTVLCMPAAILNALAVMFFNTLGLNTSFDDNGDEYVAFKDVPVFGLVTEGLAYTLTNIHSGVVYALGDPDKHEGGIYNITTYRICTPRICLPNPLPGYDEICKGGECSISIGDILDFCKVYWILDEAIEKVTDITGGLKDAWEDFRKCEIFPFDFIDVFLEKVVGFVLQNLISFIPIEDTYDLYWRGIGLPTPDSWLNQDYAVPDPRDDGDDPDPDPDPDCPLCGITDR